MVVYYLRHRKKTEVAFISFLTLTGYVALKLTNLIGYLLPNRCIRVSNYLSIYQHIQLFISINRCIYLPLYLFICIRDSVYLFLSLSLHTHTHTHIYIYIYICLFMLIYMYFQNHIHKHTHTYTYTYTPLHCHRSLVHSGPDWKHLIGPYPCTYAKLNCLK